MSNTTSLLPLRGIKILDLTRLLPGPFATQYLSDLGAEVLRVESPLPDLARLSPPYIDNIGILDLSLNRNKKSIVINLKTEKGRMIFYQLVKEYDVIVEQFRPGVTEKLEIDYNSIKMIKPDIIYCSLSGYGQTGPYRSKPAHDINYISEAGLLNDQLLTEDSFSIPQIPAADLSGSFSMVIAVLSAIIEKKVSGKGQYLDIAIFDSVVSWLNGTLTTLGAINGIFDSPKQSADYMLNGKKPFFRIYNTADSPISIGALEAHFWSELCRVLDLQQYLNEQFNEELHQQMITDIQNILLTKPSTHWETALSGICVAKVQPVSSIHQNEQLKARNMISEMVLGNDKKIKVINNPIFRSQEVFKRPPQAGEHTSEVLKKLGYEKSDIAELFEEKVVS